MSEQSKKCPICNFNASVEFKVLASHLAPVDYVCCPVCGEFYIANHIVEDITDEEKIKLKYLYATIPNDDKRRFLDYIASSVKKDEILSKINEPKNLLEKIDKVLLYIANNTIYFNQAVEITHYKSYRLFFCEDDDELRSIIDYLTTEKYVVLGGNYKTRVIDFDYTLAITAQGLQKNRTFNS